MPGGNVLCEKVATVNGCNFGEGVNRMSLLVQALDRFNRKERYCLLSEALGRPPELENAIREIGDPFIPLSTTFRAKLQKEFNLTSEIPERSWWAFDYHLDWLFAVLWLAPNYERAEELIVPPPDEIKANVNDDGRFTFNNEDCDFIVAFDSTIILIEAKIEPWANDQFKRKARRLRKISRTELDAKRYQSLFCPSLTDKANIPIGDRGTTRLGG
jgi:hypothetical protein